MAPLQILYEDNHLLVVNKPAGLPTMGATPGRPSLVEAAKQYVKKKYNKPGQVYLGVVSRLDAPVTGVNVLARTSKAAARLTQAFRDRAVEKRYWALVSREPGRAEATLRHALRKDEGRRRMVVCSAEHSAATLAELKYWRRGRAGDWTWLEVELVTGRKHQIRVQLEAARSPIVGDHRYGSHEHFAHGIALHAHRLTLPHPVRREPLTILAPTPSYWPRLTP